VQQNGGGVCSIKINRRGYVAVRQSAPTSGLLALRAGVADVGALCKIKPDTGVVVMFGEGKRWAGGYEQFAGTAAGF